MVSITKKRDLKTENNYLLPKFSITAFQYHYPKNKKN